mgnify:CR=1 FL=1
MFFALDVGILTFSKRYTEDTMKDGFIRVAAATPDIHVADPQYNSEQIIGINGTGKHQRCKGYGVSGAVI